MLLGQQHACCAEHCIALALRAKGLQLLALAAMLASKHHARPDGRCRHIIAMQWLAAMHKHNATARPVACVCCRASVMPAAAKLLANGQSLCYSSGMIRPFILLLLASLGLGPSS